MASKRRGTGNILVHYANDETQETSDGTVHSTQVARHRKRMKYSMQPVNSSDQSEGLKWKCLVQYLLGIRLPRSVLHAQFCVLCVGTPWKYYEILGKRVKATKITVTEACHSYGYDPKRYQRCLVSVCFRTSVALRFGREVVSTVSTSEYLSPRYPRGPAVTLIKYYNIIFLLTVLNLTFT